MGNGTALRKVQSRPRQGLAFFLGFLRRPKSVGSVIPSSRFLEQRIVDVAGIANAKVVVELGPGTGGTTRAILDALPANGRLLAIELDPEFVSLLRAEPDARLIVHHGSAEQIGDILRRYGLPSPDAVVSGIPFSTMSDELGLRILREVWSCLSPRGRFIAYQFRSRVGQLGRRLFGRPEVELEVLNAPPMRVYRWQKQHLAAAVESA